MLVAWDPVTQRERWRTPGGGAVGGGTVTTAGNLVFQVINDGRFRALKFWMVIRHYGVDGLRAGIREHIRLGKLFASLVESDPRFEVVAPVPFSTVCFRATPPGTPDQQNAFNERLVTAVNARGPVFLVLTKLGPTIVIRLAIGNARTQREHVAQAWELIRECAATLR